MQQQQKDKIKTRLTALDICALVNEMKNKIVSMRVSNIYNVDQKTYIFKFSKSEEKHFLIIENGVRFNLTDQESFQKSKIPSGFTMKFRKFLRSRRLEAIEQIGIERVVVLTFGMDEHKTHLILELYSQGNIILADKDYRIIQLTRQHEFSENARVAPGEIYPFEYTATNYIEKIYTTTENIYSILEKQNEKKEKEKEPEKNKKKGKIQEQVQHMKLKDIVFKVVPCLHVTLTDDLIKQKGFNPNEKVTINDIQKIKEISDYCLEYLVKFKQQQNYKGYLIANLQQQKQHQPQDQKQDKIKFFEFAPDLALYHQGKHIEEKTNFNEAVDIYFNQVDRSEEQPNIEDIAWKKFENIKQDQESRIKKLQDEQEEYIIKAKLIEDNIQDVEAILNIIKKMYEGGIQWDKISKMINDSKKDGDPLANLIYEMDFPHKKITILCGDLTSEEEMIPVVLDITLTAYQNQRKYFEQKKKFTDKEKKTREAAQQALKQAELTAQKEIDKEKQKQMKIQGIRKKYWFEKFYWFISTDGILVISGRDVQQNELIVKKYLGKDDLYMHADIYGSASTVIKNPTQKPVPDNTLQQAATATMCRSKGWEQKIVVGTWWVYSHQVSKSAPAGLFVGAGSFMIYGKKNYVYPPKLEMGYTLLFALDQESIAKHAQERKQKLENQSEFLTQKQDETTEIDVTEEIEKNVFDSDEEEEKEKEEEQSQAKTVTLTKDQIQSLGQSEMDLSEVTIVEVNPNARKIQEKNQQKSQKQDIKPKPQQQPKKQNNKPIKQEEPPKDKDDNRQVRGRKQKLKKIKEKYGDQSDDEKEIRMQLMGTKETKEMKKLKQQPQQLEEQEEENHIEEIKKPEDEKEKFKHKKQDNESITKVLLQKQNVEHIQFEEKNESKIEKVMEEKVSSDEEEEKEKKKEEEEVDNETEYQEMQKLVSYLYNDDQYVSLVPMCAPYYVISNNKYKMKIAPGSLKKGKAAKEIITYFINQKEISTYDRKLIKQLTDEEIVANLLNGVKLTAQGMLQIKQKEKQAKKQVQKKQQQKE